MPKKYYFDKPYSSGDNKHLVFPLVGVSKRGLQVRDTTMPFP